MMSRLFPYVLGFVGGLAVSTTLFICRLNRDALATKTEREWNGED